MAKTSVDIDNELLDRARSILGTKSKRETLNQALLEVVNAERRRRLIEWARQGNLGPNPEWHKKMRAPRVAEGGSFDAAHHLLQRAGNEAASANERDE